MCGRFSLAASMAEVKEHFSLHRDVVLKPRYNIAPNQFIPVIRSFDQLDFLTWGLRPVWLQDSYSSFINARADTLAEKPAFRSAFKKRRCLIVADGYFEWKAVGNRKQPYYISLSNHQLFAIAGIWEGDTCALITLDMGRPAIISQEDYAAWLNPSSKFEVAKSCLVKENSADFAFYPVSTTVNNVQNDFAECIKSLQ